MVAQSVAGVLDKHVSLDLEGIDRLYLNAYVPLLQSPGGVTYFFRARQDAWIASPVLMAPMTRAFVGSIERFARRQGLAMVRFRAGERKDAVTQARLRSFEGHEGVVCQSAWRKSASRPSAWAAKEAVPETVEGSIAPR